MSGLQVHVEGVGLFGPGLNGWQHAQEVLACAVPFESADLRLPVPEALPPAERRRVGLTLKLAMACGFEAVRHAEIDPATLPAVLSSTAGDCDNCHQILCALASDDRAVSPTRFHNSVHNMPAGYWSIATASMAPSTSLCAFDATFAAGLLEAATQVACTGKPCLLLAFDTNYPEPLLSLRPIPHALGVALVLSPVRTDKTLATLGMAITTLPSTSMDEPALERMRTQVPTARGLPVMQLLARRETGAAVIDYLGGRQLRVDVMP